MVKLESLSNSQHRIAELRHDVDEIANAPKADQQTAVKFATALVACYPGQQSSDPHVAKHFLRLLSDALAGQDLDILRTMMDAKAGIVATRRFMPNIAEVNAWINEKMAPRRARLGWYLDEIAAIERREKEQPVTPDERDRRAKMLKATAQQIRDVVNARCVGRPERRPAPQLHNPSELLDGLDYLEFMRVGQ